MLPLIRAFIEYGLKNKNLKTTEKLITLFLANLFAEGDVDACMVVRVTSASCSKK